MVEYTVLTNRAVQGYVKAVSYRQAVERAKRLYGSPIDVIGPLSSKAKV